MKASVTRDRVLVTGSCLKMRAVIRQIDRIAVTDSSVLITGESGTGKELAARRIHGQSRRAHEPFVPVNCGAIPDSLLESELFGHERGAFTGAVRRRTGYMELADRGTLFLDEIGEASVTFQVKLLRVREDGRIKRVGGEKTFPVNMRVLAATNRDLGKAMENGEVREDLYYRLAVVMVALPPLRERGDFGTLMSLSDKPPLPLLNGGRRGVGRVVFVWCSRRPPAREPDKIAFSCTGEGSSSRRRR